MTSHGFARRPRASRAPRALGKRPAPLRRGGWRGEEDSMAEPLRVAHYLNQFFAGIGGEDKADVGVSARPEPVGPGRALQAALGDAGRVVGTVIAGDNYM